ncbi:glycoside hydrolase family protein [Magnetococcales bacterium HHB-1]
MFDATQHGEQVATQINLERMKEQLSQHEGLRLKPYRCTAGKLTIGVGRNLDDNGISKAEALHLLGNDINRVISELNNSFHWFETLDEIRKRVLIDMAFNLGITTLRRFKRMLRAVEAGNYPLAAKEMLDSRWARQVGRRATKLSQMMSTGEMQWKRV